MVASKRTSESEGPGSNGLDPSALQYLVANQKGLVNDPATQVKNPDQSIIYHFLSVFLSTNLSNSWLDVPQNYQKKRRVMVSVKGLDLRLCSVY